MNKFDEKELERLLKEGRKEEAEKLFLDYLNLIKVGPEEEGRLLSEYTNAYIRITNRLKQAYSEELEGIITMLKDVKKDKEEADDKANLAKVRAELDLGN